MLAGHWADSFFGAVKLTLQKWAPLLTEKRTGDPLMGILIQCTDPDLTDMISTAFPKPSEAMLKEAWRAIPFAVEEIYAQCKMMRFNPAAPANDR